MDTNKIKQWSLIALKHTTYAAAQCFAFVACKLEDLSKFIKSKIQED